MHEGNIPARPNGKTEQPPTAPRDRLLSRGAAYTFSLAGPKALQVITLPFFVYAMSAAEFGRMALAVAVTLAVIPLLTRTLESAVFRSWFALADDHQERRRYVSTAAISLLLLPNALAVLVVLLALPYTTGSDKLPTSYLALALFAGSVVISTTVVPLSVLRAQDRLRDFVRVSLVGPAISVPVSVVAVIGFDLGARGWLAANIIGGLATLPFAAVALRDQWRPGVSRRHLRSLAAWALPSVPHGLAHWTLATSDRIILASWVTLSQLGVYNVGYQFALVLPLLYTAMNNAFSSDYGRAITDTAHRSRLPRLVTYQIFLTVAFGLIISLLAPPLIAVTLPEQFQAAQRIVPWIALGYIFFGLYFIPMNRIVILGGDVSRSWVPTSIAAIVNVLLNLAFVPGGGILAAAIITAVSYLVMLAMMSLYAWRYHPMQGGIEWRIVLGALGGLGLVYVVAVVASPGDATLALCWRSACVLACGIATLGVAWRARTRAVMDVGLRKDPPRDT